MTANCHPIPETVQAAQGLLQALGLPTLNQELLQVIGRKEGDRFKRALASAANQEPAAQECLTYIKCVISACAPATKAAAMKLGFEPPPLDVLIDVAKQEGQIFGACVRSLSSSNADPTSLASASQYLQRTFARICDRLPEGHQETPPPSSPAEPQPAPSGFSGRSDRPAPPAPPSHHDRAARGSGRPSNVTPLSRRTEAPAADAGSDPSHSTTSAEERRFVSHHLYGGKAAMCFSLDQTRQNKQPTVRVEAAPAKGEKSYDWDKKVGFQLTVAELPLVFGVLYGLTPRIELSGHGATNDKSLTIEDQGTKYFMSMRVRGGGVYAIPVLPKDTYAIMTMLFGQMKANAPNLSDQQLTAFARRVCDKSAQPVHPRAANA